LIGIAKQFRKGKPSTTYLLTPTGRRALEAHVNNLLHVVAPQSAPAWCGINVPAEPVHDQVDLPEDDWVD